jgi:hypothetical protein
MWLIYILSNIDTLGTAKVELQLLQLDLQLQLQQVCDLK